SLPCTAPAELFLPLLPCGPVFGIPSLSVPFLPAGRDFSAFSHVLPSTGRIRRIPGTDSMQPAWNLRCLQRNALSAILYMQEVLPCPLPGCFQETSKSNAGLYCIC